MDSDVIAQSLQASMSGIPSEIKASEARLTQLETQSPGGLVMLLLEMVFRDSQALAVRQSASIYCKNLLKRRWLVSPEEGLGSESLPAGEKERIRALLVEATCGANAVALARAIQVQVNAIISFVADADFPKNWPSLLPSLVQTLNSSPSNELRLNALNVLCSVFRKYKKVSRSDEVLLELKYALPLFQETHLSLFKSVLPGLMGGPASAEVVGAAEQIGEIFYSLNVIDIPEFYQDNVGEWMGGFLSILTLPTKNLEKLKAAVCENLALYADKYQEVFEPFVGSSVKAVWELLVSLESSDEQLDLLVSGGIRFLSSAANTRWTNSPFEEQAALVQICEKLVLPNVQLRESDLELFLDNPDEYIRRDLQSADSDTRRRSAMDLVKSLSKFYQERTTAILVEYVHRLLAGSNTKSKDACIQLVTAIAAKGETRAGGVSLVNTSVDIQQFYSQHLLPELVAAPTSDENEKSVLVASCLKFLILFRTQLPRHLVSQSIQPVLALVRLENCKVVQCYAAHCGFLLLGLGGLPILPPQPTVDNILRIIMTTNEQNEYLMKLLFRLIVGADASLLTAALPKLMALVGNFSANPMSAVFTHYLFEATGVAVAGLKAPSAVIIQPLCQLLERNVTEYIPYAFQILALLLEAGPEAKKSEIFVHLYGILLNEDLWKNPSLVPGLTRIVSAYMTRADVYLEIILPTLPTLVHRFAMLLNSAKFEPLAFDLLNSVLCSFPNLPVEVLSAALIALLTKIHAKRTEKVVRQLAISLSVLVASSIELDTLIQVLEKVQPGLSIQVIKDLWMNTVAGMSIAAQSVKNRKVLAMALAKLLGNRNIATNEALLQATLQATQGLVCVNPEKQLDASTLPGLAPVAADEQHEFEVGYAKLSSTVNHARETDFYPSMPGDGISQLKQAIRALPIQVQQSAANLAQWAAH